MKTKYYNDYRPYTIDDFLGYADLYDLLAKNRHRILYYLNIFAEELLKSKWHPNSRYRRGYNSLRYMAKKSSKAIKTLENYRGLLCFLRLIIRIPPPNSYEMAKCDNYKKIHPAYAEIAYYKQPRYLPEILDTANKRAQLWKQSGMTIRSVNKSSFIENFGIEIAKEVFPDYRYYADEYFLRTSKAISEQLKRLVNLYGYTTKAKIMGAVLYNYPEISKTKFLSTYPAVIYLLVDEMNLTKPHRANKAEVKKHKLNGHKFIIAKP